MFIALLSIITFAIASSAAYFSVGGLAATFVGIYYKVVVMGVVLEAGKLAAASYLYRYWKVTPWMLKTGLLIVIPILMLITSIGIFGVLSQGYQTQNQGLAANVARVELLTKEQSKLQSRKEQIDAQLAALPANSVSGRAKLSKTYAVETARINKRIPQIDSELLDLSSVNSEAEAHVGPIAFIAKAFGYPAADAIKWLAILLVVVFDPLALMMTIACSVAIEQKQLLSKTASAESNSRHVETPIPLSNSSEATKSVEPTLTLKEPQSADPLQQLMNTPDTDINSPVPEIVRRLQKARNFIDSLPEPTDNQLKTRDKIKTMFRTKLS